MTDAEAVWAARSDDELLEAARALSEYTDEGRRIIRLELRRRGLPEPPPPVGTCARCGWSIAGGYAGESCPECGEALPTKLLKILGVGSSMKGNSTPTQSIGKIVALGCVGSLVGFGAGEALLALRGVGPGSEAHLLPSYWPLLVVIASAVLGIIPGLVLYAISRSTRVAGLVAFLIPVVLGVRAGLTFVDH